MRACVLNLRFPNIRKPNLQFKFIEKSFFKELDLRSNSFFATSVSKLLDENINNQKDNCEFEK